MLDGKVDPITFGRFKWQQGDVHSLDGPLNDALRAWFALSVDSFAPKWSIGFLQAMPPSLTGMSNVIKAGDGSAPFNYRFFGTGLVDMHGFDLTGKTTAQIEPEDFRRVCIAQHTMVIEQAAPCVFLNRIPFADSPYLTLSHVMLRLPFSDDGINVTDVATVEVPAADMADMKEAFQTA